MQSQREFELSKMSYSKCNLHHVLFFPFSKYCEFTTLSTIFLLWQWIIGSSSISDSISFHVFFIFLVFDTGMLGKIRRLHWKEGLKLPILKVIRLRKVAKIYGSSYVSWKLPTYPSPKPTLTLTSHLGQNVGSREGRVGSFPKTYHLQTFTWWWF